MFYEVKKRNTEAAAHGFPGKAPVLEFLFDKVAGPRA